MLLQVFVEQGCPMCRETLRLAGEACARFPDVRVDVVNVADPAARRPESVVAVPMFLLDGQVVSLGNPSAAELMQTLSAHREGGKG